MININRVLKVTAVWISIVYSICYAGVAIYAPLRPLFMQYALHADVAITSGYFGVGYFISGLIIWNIVAVGGVWLAAYLYNRIK